MNMDERGSFVDVYRWLTQWRWCPWPHTYPILSCWTKLTARDTAVERRSPWEVMMFHTSNLHSFFQIQVGWNIYMEYHGILYKKSTNRPSSCKLIDISLTISMSLSGSQQLDGWFRRQPSSWRTGSLETNLLVTNKLSNCQICGYYTCENPDCRPQGRLHSQCPAAGGLNETRCPLGITERLRP